MEPRTDPVYNFPKPWERMPDNITFDFNFKPYNDPLFTTDGGKTWQNRKDTLQVICHTTKEGILTKGMFCINCGSPTAEHFPPYYNCP
jgi:hypothetical protein